MRVVLCAMALAQLHNGTGVSEVAAHVRLASKTVHDIGRRYQDGDGDRPLYDKQRPGAAELLDRSQKQRILAMVCSAPPGGRVRWNESPRWAGKPCGFSYSTTISNRGAGEIWCVAELKEEYIAKIEDVLKTYKKPYDPQEPVVCLDEKPVTLHADRRMTSSLPQMTRAVEFCNSEIWLAVVVG